MGGELKSVALQYAYALGIVCVCAVTRPTHFRADLDLVDKGGEKKEPHILSAKFEKYVRDESDPCIRFHTNSGAKIVRVIKGWRSADTANMGCGVLVKYTL